MSDLSTYISNKAKFEKNFNNRLTLIEQQQTQNIEDIEANAEAIEELAEIIGGGE